MCKEYRFPATKVGSPRSVWNLQECTAINYMLLHEEPPLLASGLHPLGVSRRGQVGGPGPWPIGRAVSRVRVEGVSIR